MLVDLVQLLHSSIGRIIRGLDANIFKLWLRQACILSPIVGIVIQSRITGCFSQLFLAELKEMRMSSAEARSRQTSLASNRVGATTHGPPLAFRNNASQFVGCCAVKGLT